MPRIEGTTNAMTTFLRAFRQNPDGPPANEWPTPAVLRRWLRRPAFQEALDSIRDVLRFRAEFHLTVAAAKAARDLHLPASDSSPRDHQYHRLIHLLRLAHLRQRFPVEDLNFKIPTRYNNDGERLYDLDELDNDFNPKNPFPNINPANRRGQRVPQPQITPKHQAPTP